MLRERVGHRLRADIATLTLFGDEVLYWVHEKVVLHLDMLLQRVVTHDTAIPTGTHSAPFTSLPDHDRIYVGFMKEGPSRDHETLYFTDLEALMPDCDDGPDPDLPDYILDHSMIPTMVTSSGSEEQLKRREEEVVARCEVIVFRRVDA